jgi:hypothetical protein
MAEASRWRRVIGSTGGKFPHIHYKIFILPTELLQVLDANAAESSIVTLGPKRPFMSARLYPTDCQDAETPEAFASDRRSQALRQQ